MRSAATSPGCAIDGYFVSHLAGVYSLRLRPRKVKNTAGTISFSATSCAPYQSSAIVPSAPIISVSGLASARSRSVRTLAFM